MSSFLPYGRQSISDEDVEAVAACLRSDFLTCGPRIEEFEEAFAAYVGARHAVVVNSATSALHLAMLVANIGEGDRVVTSPNTFLASANCAAFVRATPDFSDIHPVSYNLDPEALNSGWQDDTKAVVAVDYAGQACEMPRIAEVARARGAVVIEDACHGIGGAFVHENKSWNIGGHPWADMTTFSFHPVKTMTTGEGGMLVTDNESYAARARVLRHQGMVRDDRAFVGLGEEGSQPPLGEKGPWYYEMQELGYNYRITDLQCALGMSQLKRLDRFAARRREIVARYNDAFADVSFLTTPGLAVEANRELTSWHLYTLQVDFHALGKTRTEVMAQLRGQGVGTQVLYIPVHLQPYYRKQYGYAAGKCPVAEDFYTRTLSIPLYPDMKDADVDRVIAAVSALG